MNNKSSLPVITAVATAKFLPLIILCVVADFFAMGMFFMFQSYAKNFNLVWTIFVVKFFLVAFAKVKYDKKGWYLQKLLYEFLAIATINEALVCLFCYRFGDKGEALMCLTFLSAAFAFFFWAMSILFSRINFLSTSGVTSVTILFLLTFVFALSLNASKTVSAIYISPMILFFLWILATRKELLNKTGTKPEDFIFFLGFRSGSTGMKN